MAEVIRSSDSLPGSFSDSAVSIGVFDGVHVGHRKVIDALCSARAASGLGRSVLITFDRHPLSLTHPGMSPRLLTTLDEKISILRRFDIDLIIIEDFNEELAATDYREFLSKRLVGRLGMKHLVIGYDFHLGHGREGNREHLSAEGKRQGFAFTVVPPVVVNGSAVSSTRIRKNLLERRLHRAERLLSRPYFFDADVVSGRGIGRTIGFPTINLAIPDSEKLVPPRGVYAVRVGTDRGEFGGMMNIGSTPTIGPDAGRRIEAHLFDFSGDLYGSRVRTHCLEYLREEREFEGREGLKAQLARDWEAARRILEKKY